MTTTIYLNIYDRHENYKTKAFDVETEWLVNVFSLDGMSLQEYLDEYTCEEAMDIYTAALLDDAIVREWYLCGSYEAAYPRLTQVVHLL